MIPEELLDEPAPNNEVDELDDIDLGNPTITTDDVFRAKDIIAGKFIPIPLPVSQWIMDFHELDFAKMPNRPSESAVRELYESSVLNWLFPNNVVLTFKTRAGHTAVLAVGFENVVAIRNQLTPEENDKICTEVTTSLDTELIETEEISTRNYGEATVGYLEVEEVVDDHFE